MDSFTSLGERVRDAWRAAGYAEVALPDIAHRELLAAQLASRVLVSDILEWAAAASHSSTTPGELTLFRDARFRIDAVRAIAGDHGIHEADFIGALQVLDGRVLRSTYTFEAETPIADGVAAGRVEAVGVEELRDGDVVAVRPVGGTAHALVVCDDAAMLIVVRAERAPGTRPLAYLPPAIAYDDQLGAPGRHQALTALQLLYLSSRERIAALAGDTLRRGAVARAIRFIAFVCARQPSEDSCVRWVESMSAHAPILVAGLARAVPVIRRTTKLWALHKAATDPRSRYVLAVLLAAPDRTHALRLLAARMPGSAPEDVLADWIGEHFAAIAPGATGALEEPELSVLRWMLRGADDAEILERLAADYDGIADEEPALRELIGALRENIVLRGLLAPPLERARGG